MKPFLKPRLNYSFFIKYFLYSIYSLFKIKDVKNFNLSDLYDLYNTKNIYFTNQARTALRISLSSLNLDQKSKIGVQVYTCPTVFEAITRAGFELVFIDN